MSEAPALAFAISGWEEGAGSSPPALPGHSSAPAEASAGSRGCLQASVWTMPWKASLEQGECETAASGLPILEEGWISGSGLRAVQRPTANLVPFALSGVFMLLPHAPFWSLGLLT